MLAPSTCGVSRFANAPGLGPVMPARGDPYQGLGPVSHPQVANRVTPSSITMLELGEPGMSVHCAPRGIPIVPWL
jgi:hypothetical protein